jgi:hypothetical protein
MLTAWFGWAEAMIEVQQVVCLRTLRIMGGGTAATREATRMISEKIDASFDAGRELAAGRSASYVMRGYRKKIRANRRRLLK